jgi:ribose transport system ATP-binding protein
MSTARVVLRLSEVEKRYPGVRALKGVSFEVRAGEVHALVGENGAGKSTLMAVASGTIVPEEGAVEIDGARLEDPTPAAAADLGLAIVYQHNSILDDLTVAENMAFAVPSVARPRLRAARAWASERLGEMGITLPVGTRAGELGPAERQLLEIAKALVRDPKVLILDEPTESLTAAESELLFERIRRIRSRGAGIVYISHRLPEVMRIADRLSVLRDGEMRGTFARDAVSPQEVLDLIVGRSIDHAFPDKAEAIADDTLLAVDGLSGHRFHDVALRVRRGEIVGLAGIEGNGQREFLRALAGVEPSSGAATVAGGSASLASPERAQDAGIVYLPGDRHAEGLFLDLTVRENASVLVLDRMARAGMLQRDAEQRAVDEQIGALAIKTPSSETAVEALSGGNQQKVLFARSILREPTVFLAEEPSRGVDAGSRLELYRVLRGMARDGRGVVVLSADALELGGLCDRVVVFSRGRIVRELEGDEVTEANITGAAITATGEHRRDDAKPSRWAQLRRFAAGDYGPSAVLALLVVLFAAYTNAKNGAFLNERSVSGMLLLTSALAFIAFGQLCVLLTGGVDLSVGPAAGLTVVVLSFFVDTGSGAGDLVVGILAVTVIAIAVGLVNGLLVRWAGLAPVLATLATYIVLQGVSLLLRPQPEGSLATSFTGDISWQFGALPVAFVVAIVVAVAGDLLLKRRGSGLQLRAVGSNEERARRVGARVQLTIVSAYVACALLTMLGGLVLASQIGIGDPNAGKSYTLTSIAAVVLGGASIFGGRGSFVGALLGALLLQEVNSATPFLGLEQAWQYWLPGALIILAAALYTAARRGGNLRPRVA